MCGGNGFIHVPGALRDLVVVALLAVAVVSSVTWLGSGQAAAVHQMLTVAAAAIAAAAAILAGLFARLGDLPRLAWSGAALAVYGVVLIPSATLTPDGPGETAGLQAARLVAHVTVLLLLLLAVRPSRRGGAWGGWAIAAGGTVLALIAGGLVVLIPSALVGNSLDTTVGGIALVGWCWVAAVYVQQGTNRGQPALWRIGVGIAVLASAQIYRLGGSLNFADPNPHFAALRLLGLLVVAVGMAGLWLSVMRGVQVDHDRQTEALRRADVRLQHATDSRARRDHELRNGVHGLVGITALLGSPEDGCDGQLRATVLAELGRLSRLVNTGAGDCELRADVSAILQEAAALHRVAA